MLIEELDTAPILKHPVQQDSTPIQQRIQRGHWTAEQNDFIFDAVRLRLSYF